jgi:hypothetical protein
VGSDKPENKPDIVNVILELGWVLTISVGKEILPDLL